MTTIIPRLQFAQDCGIKNNDITTYAKRKKLVINGARCVNCEDKTKPCSSCSKKEYIDLDYRSESGFYLNMDFYKKWAKGVEVPKIPKVKEAVLKEKVEPPISRQVLIGPSEVEEDYPEFNDLSEQSSEDTLDRANKFKMYQNREADRRMKEITEAKLRGELMLVSDAKEMVSIFAESTKRAYADSGENVLMLVFEMCNVPENSRVMLREKLNSSINTAVKNAVRTAQARVESLENGS
jgi:hypothetical protein